VEVMKRLSRTHNVLTGYKNLVPAIIDYILIQISFYCTVV